MTIKDKNL